MKNKIVELENRYKAGTIEYEPFLEEHTAVSLKIINSGGYKKDLQEIESGIRTAVREVILYEKQIEEALVLSPIEGVVIYKDLYAGSEVREGKRIGSVLNFNTIRASLTVLEKDSHKIRSGQKAELTIGVNRDMTLTGEVKSVIPEKDSVTGGYNVIVLCRSEQFPVLKGMFVEAKIIVDTIEDTIVIPADAVLREGERYYVFVVNNELAWWRWVETGIKNDDYIEVIYQPFTGTGEAERTTGIEPGEFIATEGHSLLTHKAKVAVSE